MREWIWTAEQFLWVTAADPLPWTSFTCVRQSDVAPAPKIIKSSPTKVNKFSYSGENLSRADLFLIRERILQCLGEVSLSYFHCIISKTSAVLISKMSHPTLPKIPRLASCLLCQIQGKIYRTTNSKREIPCYLIHQVSGKDSWRRLLYNMLLSSSFNTRQISLSYISYMPRDPIAACLDNRERSLDPSHSCTCCVPTVLASMV